MSINTDARVNVFTPLTQKETEQYYETIGSCGSEITQLKKLEATPDIQLRIALISYKCLEAKRALEANIKGLMQKSRDSLEQQVENLYDSLTETTKKLAQTQEESHQKDRIIAGLGKDVLATKTLLEQRDAECASLKQRLSDPTLESEKKHSELLLKHNELVTEHITAKSANLMFARHLDETNAHIKSFKAGATNTVKHLLRIIDDFAPIYAPTAPAASTASTPSRKRTPSAQKPADVIDSLHRQAGETLEKSARKRPAVADAVEEIATLLDSARNDPGKFLENLRKRVQMAPGVAAAAAAPSDSSSDQT